MQIWLNGEIVAPEHAHVAIDDHALVVGDGAFETMKTVRGEPLGITRHLRRLTRTCAALGIELPPATQFHDAVAECLQAFRAAHPDDEARIRLTVTGGTGSLGTPPPSGTPSIIVATTVLGPKAAPTAMTVPWTRNERGATAGLKTTSYAENVRALRAAHAAGASEALFANTQGNLCEGTGTNVFVVVDGECITPPLSAGCLAGVTRELALEVAEVAERDLPIDVLTHADEVFLTSSTRDVQGLERIDDRKLAVGPVTAGIADAFAALIAGRTDP